MGTLRIHNWDKWQSYRSDRCQPPWLKIHRRLLREPKWLALSDAQRGQLVCIWLLAADEHGQIPDDANFIRRVCGFDTDFDLNLFIRLGLIDAKAPSRRRQRDASVTHQTRLDKTRLDQTRQDKNEPRARDEFAEIFWPEFPNKVGKPKARQSFATARKHHDLQTIMGGLDRYIATKPPDRQWLNPTTFLNQERFLDVPAPVGPARSRTMQAAENLIRKLENGNGTSGRGVCSQGSSDARRQLPKPTPRPGDVSAASDDGADGTAEEAAPKGGRSTGRLFSD